MGRGQARTNAERNNAAKTGILALARSEKYLSEHLSIKLAQLACNLKRVSTLARASSISNTRLDVCRYFIEWSAPELLPARVDDAARLVDIQRGLTQWYWSWDSAHHDPAARTLLAGQAQQWSDEVLAMSGLLDTELGSGKLEF